MSARNPSMLSFLIRTHFGVVVIVPAFDLSLPLTSRAFSILSNRLSIVHNAVAYAGMAPYLFVPAFIAKTANAYHYRRNIAHG
jgi:hypothetical protein